MPATKPALVPYTPETWTDYQLGCHRAVNLDEAMYKASCLAGGWYGRPVTIDYQIRGDEEFYSMRPDDVPTPDGWEPVYTIQKAERRA